MSSTNGTPVSADPIVTNMLREYVANALTEQRDWWRRRGQILDKRRDISAECGYPLTAELTPQYYQELFDRDPLANRVVGFWPSECWQVSPSVYESEDAENITPFEEAWDALGQSLVGEQSWFQDEEGSPLWHYCEELDLRGGIGRYGIALLGLDDGVDDLSKPVAGVEEVGSAPAGKQPDGVTLEPSLNAGKYRLTINAEKTKNRKLLFIRVFPETLAEAVQFETNRSSPRYCKPVMYQVTFQDPQQAWGYSSGGSETRYVHWTRVVHFSEGHVFHTPRIQPVLNNILNARKVYGADGEAFWLNAFMHWFLETPEAFGGDVDIDRQAIKDELEKMFSSSQRFALLNGVSAKNVPPALVDPSPHLAIQIEAICIQIPTAVRIFKGSERGELASSQDERLQRKRTGKRQRRIVTPKLVVPLTNRLILLGVLPAPTRPRKGPTINRWVRVYNEKGQPIGRALKTKVGYSIFWPDLDTQTDGEKAAVALQKTQALSAYVSGGCDVVVAPMDYLTRYQGFTEEEATAILEATTQHQEEQQTAEMDQQQEKIDRGLVPDPQPEPAQDQGQGGQQGQTGDSSPSVNAFCSTGPGGGIDPTCSPGEGQGDDAAGGTAEEAGPLPEAKIMRHAQRVSPSALSPINETDQVVVSALAESMRQSGWVGMPLLEVDGNAFTGSHRLAAAQRAGLKEIPVISVDKDEFVAAARAAGLISKHEGWHDLRIASDDERLDVVRRLPGTAANRAALAVMEAEVDRNYERFGSRSRLEPRALAANIADQQQQGQGNGQQPAANYDPKQPRVPAGTPEGGEWTTGGGATATAALVAPVQPAPIAAPAAAPQRIAGAPTEEHRAAAHRWAAASPGLSSAMAAEYTEHLSHALSVLPAGISAAASESLSHGGVRFHPDTKALAVEAKKLTGKASPGIVGFAHDHGMGTDVHLDGGADPRGTYVHELWHAADQGGFHSDDKGWQAAYKKDILKGKTLLSRYAMTNPSEGFAEFGRVLAERGPAYMEAHFPTCWKHLKAKGLV